ncbi:hypothetical protein M0638_11470 [Roseomonas sp. NAR14]|uniref:Uncharacterized protein n=1 Tax=Roseomonas acroporae TaxID=2937791 RepID=A0A9X1Y8F8_9PROT|nr:hypothetical protein [Roseomonas acroporae]MCK8785002.1 hypothetical protein [Roseomonas acroporae]
MATGTCGDDCACRRAVLTAYRELTARYCSDRRALACCAMIYRCHHAAEDGQAAASKVRQWVDATTGRRLPARRRGAAGRAPVPQAAIGR